MEKESARIVFRMRMNVFAPAMDCDCGAGLERFMYGVEAGHFKAVSNPGLLLRTCHKEFPRDIAPVRYSTLMT